MSKWKSFPVDHISKLEQVIQNSTDEICQYDRTVFFNPRWKTNSFNDYNLDIQKDNVSLILSHNIIEEKIITNNSNDYDYDLNGYVKNDYDYFIQNNSRIGNPFSQYIKNNDIRNRNVYNYNITYSFDIEGKLISFNITHDSRVLFSLFVGKYKLCVNMKEWHDIENFEEKAFQNSLVQKREPFDMYFVSILLKSFNTI